MGTLSAFLTLDCGLFSLLGHLVVLVAQIISLIRKFYIVVCGPILSMVKMGSSKRPKCTLNGTGPNISRRKPKIYYEPQATRGSFRRRRMPLPPRRGGYPLLFPNGNITPTHHTISSIFLYFFSIPLPQKFSINKRGRVELYF